MPRNYDVERAEHIARQKRADDKIERQEDLMAGDDPSLRGDHQRIMNEMRGNKASLDLNRALFDYDVEQMEGGICSAGNDWHACIRWRASA